VLHTCLALVLFGVPFLGLVAPATRRFAAVVLAGAALALLALAIRGRGGEAALTVTHACAAYVGSDVVSKTFVVDEASAPAWQWPAVAALWAALWATWAAGGSRRRPRPIAGPIYLAWGGAAFLLALQKLAAPAPLALGLDLAPLPPFELALWPAMLAAAILLARRETRVLTFVAHLSVTIELAHLPLAIFGTLATRQELGTYLDVHTIEHIANPLTQMSLPLEPKSEAQLAWLVWIPQLIVWPGLTMLSAGGAGFAALMLRKQRSVTPRRAS
jgi:hypothetical protein